MLVIRWKKNPARLPAACVFTAVTLAGGALIRLSVKERIAEQQALAATLGSQAAYRVEQRVDRELAIVEAFARDLGRRTTPPFEEKVAAGERPTDQRTLFSVSATTQSAAPPADAVESGAMGHWAADLWRNAGVVQQLCIFDG